LICFQRIGNGPGDLLHGAPDDARHDRDERERRLRDRPRGGDLRDVATTRTGTTSKATTTTETQTTAGRTARWWHAEEPFALKTTTTGLKPIKLKSRSVLDRFKSRSVLDRFHASSLPAKSDLGNLLGFSS
jgi:hypothetical protein